LKKKHVAKVRYIDETISIKTSPDLSLLENLVKAKVPIGRSCNGEGICTTCRVIIHKGDVTQVEGIEEQRIQERGFNHNERLACQCRQTSTELFIEVP